MNRLILAVAMFACSCTDTPSHEYAAVIRGTLATTDLAQAKAIHDRAAQDGRQAASARGDLAHDVLLGTTMLDSTPNEFLAIDRWNDGDAMGAFYANPSAFSSLFATPPSMARTPDRGYFHVISCPNSDGRTCFPDAMRTSTGLNLRKLTLDGICSDFALTESLSSMRDDAQFAWALRAASS